MQGVRRTHPYACVQRAMDAALHERAQTRRPYELRDGATRFRLRNGMPQAAAAITRAITSARRSGDRAVRRLDGVRQNQR